MVGIYLDVLVVDVLLVQCDPGALNEWAKPACVELQ